MLESGSSSLKLSAIVVDKAMRGSFFCKGSGWVEVGDTGEHEGTYLLSPHVSTQGRGRANHKSQEGVKTG
jgi:hypothetical protein